MEINVPTEPADDTQELVGYDSDTSGDGNDSSSSSSWVAVSNNIDDQCSCGTNTPPNEADTPVHPTCGSPVGMRVSNAGEGIATPSSPVSASSMTALGILGSWQADAAAVPAETVVAQDCVVHADAVPVKDSVGGGTSHAVGDSNAVDSGRDGIMGECELAMVDGSMACGSPVNAAGQQGMPDGTVGDAAFNSDLMQLAAGDPHDVSTTHCTSHMDGSMDATSHDGSMDEVVMVSQVVKLDADIEASSEVGDGQCVSDRTPPEGNDAIDTMRAQVMEGVDPLVATKVNAAGQQGMPGGAVGNDAFSPGLSQLVTTQPDDVVPRSSTVIPCDIISGGSTVYNSQDVMSALQSYLESDGAAGDTLASMFLACPAALQRWAAAAPNSTSSAQRLQLTQRLAVLVMRTAIQRGEWAVVDTAVGIVERTDHLRATATRGDANPVQNNNAGNNGDDVKCPMQQWVERNVSLLWWIASRCADVVRTAQSHLDDAKVAVKVLQVLSHLPGGAVGLGCALEDVLLGLGQIDCESTVSGCVCVIEAIMDEAVGREALRYALQALQGTSNESSLQGPAADVLHAMCRLASKHSRLSSKVLTEMFSIIRCSFSSCRDLLLPLDGSGVDVTGLSAFMVEAAVNMVASQPHLSCRMAEELIHLWDVLRTAPHLQPSSLSTQWVVPITAMLRDENTDACHKVVALQVLSVMGSMPSVQQYISISSTVQAAVHCLSAATTKKLAFAAMSALRSIIAGSARNLRDAIRQGVVSAAVGLYWRGVVTPSDGLEDCYRFIIDVLQPFSTESELRVPSKVSQEIMVEDGLPGLLLHCLGEDDMPQAGQSCAARLLSMLCNEEAVVERMGHALEPGLVIKLLLHNDECVAGTGCKLLGLLTTRFIGLHEESSLLRPLGMALREHPWRAECESGALDTICTALTTIVTRNPGCLDPLVSLLSPSVPMPTITPLLALLTHVINTRRDTQRDTAHAAGGDDGCATDVLTKCAALLDVLTTSSSAPGVQSCKDSKGCLFSEYQSAPGSWAQPLVESATLLMNTSMEVHGMPWTQMPAVMASVKEVACLVGSGAAPVDITKLFTAVLCFARIALLSSGSGCVVGQKDIECLVAAALNAALPMVNYGGDGDNAMSQWNIIYILATAELCFEARLGALKLLLDFSLLHVPKGCMVPNMMEMVPGIFTAFTSLVVCGEIADDSKQLEELFTHMTEFLLDCMVEDLLLPAFPYVVTAHILSDIPSCGALLNLWKDRVNAGGSWDEQQTCCVQAVVGFFAVVVECCRTSVSWEASVEGLEKNRIADMAEFKVTRMLGTLLHPIMSLVHPTWRLATHSHASHAVAHTVVRLSVNVLQLAGMVPEGIDMVAPLVCDDFASLLMETINRGADLGDALELVCKLAAGHRFTAEVLCAVDVVAQLVLLLRKNEAVLSSPELEERRCDICSSVLNTLVLLSTRAERSQMGVQDVSIPQLCDAGITDVAATLLLGATAFGDNHAVLQFLTVKLLEKVFWHGGVEQQRQVFGSSVLVHVRQMLASGAIGEESARAAAGRLLRKVAQWLTDDVAV